MAMQRSGGREKRRRANWEKSKHQSLYCLFGELNRVENYQNMYALFESRSQSWECLLHKETLCYFLKGKILHGSTHFLMIISTHVHIRYALIQDKHQSKMSFAIICNHFCSLNTILFYLLWNNQSQEVPWYIASTGQFSTNTSNFHRGLRGH